MVSTYATKKWLRQAILIALVFVIALPVFNAARGRAIGYYRSQLRPSAEWLVLMRESAQDAFYSSTNSELRSFADPFFERLNGSEALAVTEKYAPRLGYEGGKTYANLFLLLLPRQLRPGSGQPYYINWAVDYVGLAPSNPTVIPMPAIVEGFVNFGVVGVIIVMLLLGLLYGLFDWFLQVFGRNPMATGLFAYAVWRSMNIEHNLFIYLPALVKTVAVVLALCWVYSRIVSAMQRREFGPLVKGAR
jgi:hypothetical protein